MAGEYMPPYYPSQPTRTGRNLSQHFQASPSTRFSQFVKTELCRFHAQNKCRYGAKCSFAHGEAEKNVRPDFTKTALCQLWLEGKCGLSLDECQFAHGAIDLRKAQNFEEPWLGGHGGGVATVAPNCVLEMGPAPSGASISQHLPHRLDVDRFSTMQAPPRCALPVQMTAPQAPPRYSRTTSQLASRIDVHLEALEIAQAEVARLRSVAAEEANRHQAALFTLQSSAADAQATIKTLRTQLCELESSKVMFEERDVVESGGEKGSQLQEQGAFKNSFAQEPQGLTSVMRRGGIERHQVANEFTMSDPLSLAPTAEPARQRRMRQVGSAAGRDTSTAVPGAAPLNPAGERLLRRQNAALQSYVHPPPPAGLELITIDRDAVAALLTSAMPLSYED